MESKKVFVQFTDVIAPLLNKLDHKSGLHEPREHGVERKYHLTLDIRTVELKTLAVWRDRTAKPMRVAMEELQLQLTRLAEHRGYRFEMANGQDMSIQYRGSRCTNLRWT